MWCYYRANHATITNLNGALIEYLTENYYYVENAFFTSFYAVLPILLSTFIEHGGLNYIIFLFLVIFLSELLLWITGV